MQIKWVLIAIPSFLSFSRREAGTHAKKLKSKIWCPNNCSNKKIPSAKMQQSWYLPNYLYKWLLLKRTKKYKKVFFTKTPSLPAEQIHLSSLLCQARIFFSCGKNAKSMPQKLGLPSSFKVNNTQTHRASSLLAPSVRSLLVDSGASVGYLVTIRCEY